MTAADNGFAPEELAEARRYSMLITWSPEDDAYLVTVPEIPELPTRGQTHEEAVTMGEEAIATWLSGLRSLGRTVAEPGYAIATVR